MFNVVMLLKCYVDVINEIFYFFFIVFFWIKKCVLLYYEMFSMIIVNWVILYYLCISCMGLWY